MEARFSVSDAARTAPSVSWIHAATFDGIDTDGSEDAWP
jgi:hypothetical protein